MKSYKIVFSFFLFYAFLQTNLAAQQQSPSGQKDKKAYQGYGEQSLAPETVKKFAPAPLPAQLASEVQRYLDVRSPGSGMPTNNGKQLFFTWGVTGTRQIWRQQGANSFPTQMTGGDLQTGASFITHDQNNLVISRDQNGKEAPGIYLQPVTGGVPKVIFQQDKIVAMAAFESKDGRSLYYLANDVQPQDFAVYRYDMKTQNRELVFGEPGNWRISDHINEDKLLLTKAVGSYSDEVYEYDIKAKKLTAIFGEDARASYDVTYAAQDDELLVATDKMSDFRRLYRFQRKASKFIPISREFSGDVEYFDIDEDRQRIVYGTNDQGFMRAYALSAKDYKSLLLPEFKGAENIIAGKFSNNGRFLSIQIGASQRPFETHVYDWQSKSVVRWISSSVPEFGDSHFVGSTVESYLATDGTKIPMIVRRPKSCIQPCPVIVHFHGGPEGQSRPGFNLMAQFYVDQGFVFVEPNVRGSTGYGKIWRDSDNGAKRLQVVSDIRDAAVYIRKNWQVDGKAPKIGVMGYSYGGYSALMAMSYFAGAYDAGVANVGISNFISFLANTAPYRRALRVNEYGDPEKEPEVLKQLSPVTYLDKIKSPLMIIQGLNDPRVPAGEAVQIYDALASKGIAARLMIFPDEGHGPGKRDNRALDWGHTLAFFKEHLAQPFSSN